MLMLDQYVSSDYGFVSLWLDSLVIWIFAAGKFTSHVDHQWVSLLFFLMQKVMMNQAKILLFYSTHRSSRLPLAKLSDFLFLFWNPHR